MIMDYAIFAIITVRHALEIFKTNATHVNVSIIYGHKLPTFVRNNALKVYIL
jgi:hypothetical protein